LSARKVQFHRYAHYKNGHLGYFDYAQYKL